MTHHKTGVNLFFWRCLRILLSPLIQQSKTIRVASCSCLWIMWWKSWWPQDTVILALEADRSSNLPLHWSISDLFWRLWVWISSRSESDFFSNSPCGQGPFPFYEYTIQKVSSRISNVYLLALSYQTLLVTPSLMSPFSFHVLIINFSHLYPQPTPIWPCSSDGRATGIM